ncbi:MAG: M56 family metallopeptidase [Tahibacter sp.]
MDAWLIQLDAAIPVMGWVLVHFLWQGALIGLIYGSVRRALKPGQARHALALLAFLALAVSPVITTWVLAAADPTSASVVGASAHPAMTSVVTAEGTSTLIQWDLVLPWLVALWGTGVALLTGRALLHWHQLSRMMRRASAMPAAWQARFAAICDRFEIRRAVRLLWSEEVQTPTLIGWIKPVILLPAAVAMGFPVAQIELILAHELGHLRRWDHLVNLLQVVVETILFYHPVVHWISRDLRHEREICCDELVLERGNGTAREYMRTLADLEELRLHGHGTLALTATGGILLERVQHIAGIPVAPLNTRAPTKLLPLLVGGIALLCIVALQQSRNVQIALVDLLSPRQMRALFEPIQGARVSALPGISDLVLERAARPQPFRLPSEDAVVSGIGSASTGLAPAAASVLANVVTPAELAATPNLLPRETVEAPAPPTPGAVSVDAKVTPLDLAATIQHSAEPVVLRSVQPVYPQGELERGAEGKAQLSFTLDSNGSVHDIEVVTPRPTNAFDIAAMNALRRWRFDPASIAGAGIRYNRTFVFALGGSHRLRDGAAEEVSAGIECRLVTGTRICRRAGEASEPALSSR